jgi:hypothetical protein
MVSTKASLHQERTIRATEKISRIQRNTGEQHQLQKREGNKRSILAPRFIDKLILLNTIAMLNAIEYSRFYNFNSLIHRKKNVKYSLRTGA